MLAFLLFTVAFAGKVYYKSLEDFSKIGLQSHELVGVYMKFIPYDCNYAPGAGSFKLSDDNKIAYYKSKDCSGDQLDANSVEALAMDVYLELFKGELKEEPGHAGFINYPDEANCPNEKYSMRFYFDNACFYESGKKISMDYKEEGGKFYAQKYSDEKCGTKSGDKVHLFDCDKCSNGLKYQCGAFSTMILAIFLVLAFLF